LWSDDLFRCALSQAWGKDHETPRIEGNNLLEVIWTVVPTIICIFVAYYGIVIYNEMVESPEDALVINARARRWAWDFQYQNGKSTTGQLVVPVGKPVRIVMTSSDVIHSFFVPAMRVKKDAIPERYTYVSFTPVRTGEYPAFVPNTAAWNTLECWPLFALYQRLIMSGGLMIAQKS
jgi:cytochrome c oxidase subunit II